MSHPPNCWRLGVAGAAAKHRQRREKWAAEGVLLWEQWRHDPFFLLGIGLYWGEGAKVCRATQTRLALSNSDPGLLRVWVSWSRRFLPGVPVYSELTVHDTCNVQAAQQFWERELNIRVTSVTVAVSLASKRKRNSLPNGALRVRVGRGSVEWLTKMLTWIELAQVL
jgi:hypothetical protein